jgi:4-amino-4-deoxy-L-arabinose transferase-like glycosyltransferase
VSASKQRLAVAGLVGLVVLLRVILVLVVHGADPDRAVTDDTLGYTEPARSLVEDGDFDLAPGSDAPEFQRTPGYPAFVAVVYWLTDDSDRAVVVAQAALSGLSVLLAVLLARRLTGSFGLGLLAGALVGFDPLQAAQSGLIVSETLATIFTMLTAYCAVRFLEPAAAGWPVETPAAGVVGDGQAASVTPAGARTAVGEVAGGREHAPGMSVRWGVACGVSLVVATYVRPTTYYFPLAVLGGLGLLAILCRADRATLVRGAAAFGIPCIVLLGAWNVRNHEQVDSWRYSGLEGTNLYWYRAAAVIADRDGADLVETQVQMTEDLSRGEVPPFDYEDYRSGQPPPAWQHRQGEYYDRASREAVDILKDEPVLAAKEYVRAVYGQVVQSGWNNAFTYALGDSPPALLTAPGLPIVWAIEGLAVIGAFVALRRKGPDRLAHVLLVSLVAYVILVTAAGPDAGGGFRFRIPIWPLWCLYAVLGVQAVLAFVAARRSRQSESESASEPAQPTEAVTTTK